MELVEGIDLVDFMIMLKDVKMKLDERHYRYLFKEIAYALHQLHKAGVSHRDIKPDNMMLTADGCIKLIDFGMGVPMSGTSGQYLMETKKGTQMYKAPEINEELGYQGTQIDIFAFGVSTLALRTFKFPFGLADKNDSDYQCCIEGLDDFWEEKPYNNLPEEFKNFIILLLQEDPDVRPVMSDLLSHPYMMGDTCTAEEFIATYNKVVGAKVK